MKKHELVPLDIMPGLYTLKTDRGAKNRWRSGDHVRWFRGVPQKIGGWTKTIAASFLGICRGMLDWQSFSFEQLIGLGTHLKLYIQKGGVFYDITPILSSGTFANNPYATTNASSSVTVNHVAHGRSVGDYIHFAGASTFNNVTMNGDFSVVSVIDADNYTITATTTANATGSGGGAACTYQYEISIGNANSGSGLGWGAGAWGSSTWGTARASSSFISLCRIWSIDTFGEDMVACPRGGGIYTWDASTGTGTRAVVLTNAPTTAKAVLTSIENRHIIALGAHDGSVSNPLLIRWCSSDASTSWTPASTNTAGRKQLDSGNEIYCGIKVGREILVHTDSSFTAMVFEGPPYTFGFYSKGSNGGLVGPNAAKEFDGRGWWMGEQDFFVYDGRMRVLPCEVRNYVFDDITVSQRAKIFAGANRWFGEVWWLYPSANSTECDRYVLYNVWENTWSFGTLARTAFVGDSKLFGPYMAGTDGYIYDHESGVNAENAALASSLESWDMEIGEGEYQMRVHGIIPDFVSLTGNVDISMTGKKYPQSTSSVTKSLGACTSSTEYMKTNLRARQISLSLSTDGIGETWKLGTLRLELSPHGKR